MRRQLPAVAIGALLALVALVAVVALRPGPAPTTAERADLLARELRCPDCQALSVADSPTSSAREIRRQVDELLAGGASGAEVREHFVARYGAWILLAPASPLPWLVPIAVVLAGTAGLLTWLARRRLPATDAATQLTSEERRRLHDEAEALDA
jgi:cytochrome c-type biogenesis protein CcmH/NrfF